MDYHTAKQVAILLVKETSKSYVVFQYSNGDFGYTNKEFWKNPEIYGESESYFDDTEEIEIIEVLSHEANP